MNKNKGSITIEVCITFVIFIAMLLVLTTIIQANITYARVQYGLNQVAKEIASYSYLYASSGIMKLNEDLQDQISSQSEKLDETAEALLNIYNSLSNNSNSENSNTVIKNLKNLSTDTTTVIENIKHLSKEPEKLITSLIYLGLEDQLVQIRSKIIAAISENMLPKYLSSSDESYKRALKGYGIIEPLNLEGCRFLEDGESVYIEAKYILKKTLPIIGDITFSFCQSAKARAWLLGDANIDPNYTPGDTDSLTSVWHGSNFTRGKKIIANEQKMFKYKIINASGLHAVKVNNNYLDIYRFVTYDSNTASNNPRQFEKLISKHFTALNDKVSSLNQLNIENVKTKKRSLIALGSSYKITKILYVIVPEDIEQTELNEMLKKAKELTSQNKASQIIIKKGYGNSKKEE